MHILYPRNISVITPKSCFALFKNCISQIVLSISQQYLCDNFIIFNGFTHNLKYYNQYLGFNFEVNISEILKVNKTAFNIITADNLLLLKSSAS